MQQTLARCRLLLPISAVPLIWVLTPAMAQTIPSSPPISAPGQLVDLGGWRIHLNCTGQDSASQPTVILEAGAGGFSVDWSLVQSEVARFARVCSYDRAGLGWSDLGPRPRTLRQVVWELHTLLEKPAVRPPYLLVGHSYGGILARLYAFTYPSEVVGIVLEESGYESGVAVFRNGRMVRLVETATGRPIPPVKTSNPLHESDLTGDIRSQIEAAARQMAPHANDPPYNKLPPEAHRMRAWAFSQLKHWATNDNPFEGEELAAMLVQQGKKEHPLGDMPLIVLSRGMAENAGPEGRAVEDEHKRNQAALVALSSVCKQFMAQHSGHEILISEPDLVVNAIRDVMAATRR
jgi:pimeloyl-ACP methyl ester carboxylesterase